MKSTIQLSIVGWAFSKLQTESRRILTPVLTLAPGLQGWPPSAGTQSDGLSRLNTKGLLCRLVNSHCCSPSAVLPASSPTSLDPPLGDPRHLQPLKSRPSRAHSWPHQEPLAAALALRCVYSDWCRYVPYRVNVLIFTLDSLSDEPISWTLYLILDFKIKKGT